MKMTHASLLHSMTNSEFMYWVAMEQLDPLPDPWLTNALNCQTIANVWRGKGKPYTIDQWLPVKKPKKKEMNEIDLKNSFRKLIKKQHT